MTAETIARLTAALDLNPADAGALAELRAAKYRADLIPDRIALVEVAADSLDDADILAGWDWFCATVEAVRTLLSGPIEHPLIGRTVWFAAPDLETAEEWASDWICSLPDWQGLLFGSVRATVAPLKRTAGRRHKGAGEVDTGRVDYAMADVGAWPVEGDEETPAP